MSLSTIFFKRGSSPLLEVFYCSTPLCAALRNEHRDAASRLFSVENYDLDASDFGKTQLRWRVDQSKPHLKSIFIQDKESGGDDERLPICNSDSGSEDSAGQPRPCDICTVEYPSSAPHFICEISDAEFFMICKT